MCTTMWVRVHFVWSYLSLLLFPCGVEESLPLPLLLLLHVLVLVHRRPELVRVGGRHLQWREHEILENSLVESDFTVTSRTFATQDCPIG